MTGLTPTPPDPIKATASDVAQLAALVDRLGWEEFMWHVGQLLGSHYEQAQGPHKGALMAGRDTINTFVNSFRYCDPANAAHLIQQIRQAASGWIA